MVEFKEKLPVGRKVDVDTMVTGTDDLIEEIMCTDSTKYLHCTGQWAILFDTGL